MNSKIKIESPTEFLQALGPGYVERAKLLEEKGVQMVVSFYSFRATVHDAPEKMVAVETGVRSVIKAHDEDFNDVIRGRVHQLFKELGA